MTKPLSMADVVNAVVEKFMIPGYAENIRSMLRSPFLASVDGLTDAQRDALLALPDDVLVKSWAACQPDYEDD